MKRLKNYSPTKKEVLIHEFLKATCTDELFKHDVQKILDSFRKDYRYIWNTLIRTSETDNMLIKISDASLKHVIINANPRKIPPMEVEIGETGKYIDLQSHLCDGGTIRVYFRSAKYIDDIVESLEERRIQGKGVAQVLAIIRAIEKGKVIRIDAPKRIGYYDILEDDFSLFD